MTRAAVRVLVRVLAGAVLAASLLAVGAAPAHAGPIYTDATRARKVQRVADRAHVQVCFDAATRRPAACPAGRGR